MHDFSVYPDAIRAVLEAQTTVGRCTVGIGSEEWAHLDLSIGQLKVLMLLAGLSDPTISQLAQHLKLGKPSSSILVDRLVQLGLVQRTEDASDRRRTRVTLTSSGSELVGRLHQGSIERFVQWLQAMTPDDLAALRRGLEALAKIASRSDGAIECDTSGAFPIPQGANSGPTHRDE
jgi:MarR family transcriptional regulator, organic hydroperoxide resistance regulator